MKRAELLRAVEPVRPYFHGRLVTEKTVLAAYLRSHGLPASGEPWEVAKRALRAGASFEAAVLAARSEPQRAVEAAPEPVQGAVPAPFGGDALSWFPKPFGPGDLDGVGARRLLGTPAIDRASLLVRETAQNSWDARGASPHISFVLNLRQIEGEALHALRSRVLAGDAPRTGLSKLLREDLIWALEVVDRGTVGLGGPVRNDLAVEPGEDTNFIDLVFNIGAPRDVHLGGGTYGFGKTIAYVVSGVGTVLIWSRCEGQHGAEHRIIGSAIGDAFDMNGYRYTGRHWWGNAISGEDRVEPATGPMAQDLGESVFACHFGEDETGTSLLILDPQLEGETPEEIVENLVQAVVANLWPKLLTDQRDLARMGISVQLNGEPVPLPEIENHPVLSGYADCLRAVRAVQAGESPDALGSRYSLEVREIWAKLPQTLLGHLALTRYPAPAGADESAHSISLMRNQAELVVKYLERPELDVEGFQWAGVFKPTEQVDDSFALAEPPAHDDWVPQSIPDKQRRREVNIALRRVREQADDFLAPPSHEPTSGEDVPSAANVGDMLADLLGGLEGPAPSGRKQSSRGGGRPRRTARVEVIAARREPAEAPGWTRTILDARLSDGPPSGAVVEIAVRVGVDGGSWDDDESVRVLGWIDDARGVRDTRPRLLRPGAVCQFGFEARSELAIDVTSKVVNPDG